ncbi:MAG: PD-(D/E)XK nuclease family protein, partial [Candidatus Xenobia bacterium]
SCVGAARLEAAAAWLADIPPARPVLVVGASWEACDEVCRRVTRERAAFGLYRMTLDRLAATLAQPALAGHERAAATRLSFMAVVARAVHRLQQERRLSWFDTVAGLPGFAPALVDTLAELRMNRVLPENLERLAGSGSDLAALSLQVERELAAAKLADRALIYLLAQEAAPAATAPVGLALLLLDVELTAVRQRDLLEALAARAPAVMATAAHGDSRSIEHLERALGVHAEQIAIGPDAALSRLQTHLFEAAAPPQAARDDTVTLSSAPGEARECVEMARRILGHAARGVPFDRIGIFLHAPRTYQPHLQEALERAGVPAFYTHGTRRPHPSGRALLALLACAAERLSARRFGEYLSLAQVPDAKTTDARFVPPRDDLLASPELESPPAVEEADETLADPTAAAVLDGTLQAPWRWEQLIVEAAVIGGLARWKRRLAGLAEQLRLEAQRLAQQESPQLERVVRARRDLEHLRQFALPVLERLEALPRSGTWEEWLVSLREVARHALREPDPVLRKLEELAPMGAVGPVGLDEVQRVLTEALRDVAVAPPRRRYGAVFVGTPEHARGLAFDVVFVPGLAERIFPNKIVEDPILLDAAREQLPHELIRQRDRAEAERLALRLAVGAARSRIELSYPRVDVDQARARVWSFYVLEAMRASEGTLPGLDALARRAALCGGSRLGWPAPERPQDAIDEAEYDLALLDDLVRQDPAHSEGSARYLLQANTHLTRALRARGRRWHANWHPVDGLVDPDEAARQALVRHQLGARAWSPTALQLWAVCPYKFYLSALARLEPREEPEALEALDPLTRGSLYHEVLFHLMTSLRAQDLLPLKPEALGTAQGLLDGLLDEVAEQYRENLAFAIPRVWEDAMHGIKADLREFLRRLSQEETWIPERFELNFGLREHPKAQADPASVTEPVRILGRLPLRGSIDLVEQDRVGRRRVTDYKTGKATGKEHMEVQGGEILQPLLYALVVEALLDTPVASGRLYYCTTDGGFTPREVPLHEGTRATLEKVVSAIEGSLEQGFLPAAPRRDACTWCDFRPVCGPHEEARLRRKSTQRLNALQEVRELP